MNMVAPDPIETLYENLKPNTIKEFIIKYAQKNEEFKKYFLQINNKKETEKPLSYNDYIEDIEICFKETANAEPEEQDIASKLRNHIEEAQFSWENKETLPTVYKLLSIIETTCKYNNRYSNPNGDIYCECQQAIEFLEEIINSSLCSKEIKVIVHNKLIELYEEIGYDDFCFIDFEDLLISLSIQTTSFDKGLQLIDELINTTKNDEWSSKKYILLKIKLLRENGKETEAKNTIEDYLHVSDIRKIKIARLIEKKRYNEAISCIDEGIVIAKQKGNLGVLNDWKDLLLEIYIKQNDYDRILPLAEDLFNHGCDQKKYYQILKKYTAGLQWVELQERLLSSLKDIVFLGHVNEIKASIYVDQQMWKDLLKLVSKGTLLCLDTYEKDLKIRFSEKVLLLYAEKIEAYTEKNTGKETDAYIVEILKKMRTYPNGNKIVDKIIADFQIKYKKRESLLEELKHV